MPHNTLKWKLENQALPDQAYRGFGAYKLTPPGGSRCVLFAWSKQERNESMALKRNNRGSPERGMVAEMILLMVGSLAVQWWEGRRGSGGRPRGTGTGPAATAPGGRVRARALLTNLTPKGRSRR